MKDHQVAIRRLHSEDARIIAALADNKKTWDNVRDHMPHPYTEADAAKFIASTGEEDPARTFGILFEGAICGAIGLIERTGNYRHSAEMGYWIGELYWGRGIATRAVDLITIYGFRELQLERISAAVYAFNHASMRVLEKNAYVREGIFRRGVLKNGVFCDEYQFARLRSDTHGPT